MSNPGKPVAVVLGGSGFMGSHVADALSESGYQVRVVDRTPSPWLNNGQTMIEADLADVASLRRAFEGASCVLHFAGIADIAKANENPRTTAEINLLGTINALDAAVACGVKRFCFASTVYVYSDMGGFYRASKQACESFIESYRQEYGLPFTVLRYGTLYGRRAGPTNRIYAMITAALQKGAIEYPGSGEAQRDFIHVRDAARLTVRTLSERYENQYLMITGQERMRVRDIAQIIREILKGKVELKFADGEPEGHYLLTPYSFSPRLSQKLVPSDYVDIGQGILDCIEEQWNEANHPDRVYVPGKTHKD